MRVSVPGIATGLAWTAVGGDILFIEATKTPGHGRLIRRDYGDIPLETRAPRIRLAGTRRRRRVGGL